MSGMSPALIIAVVRALSSRPWVPVAELPETRNSLTFPFRGILAATGLLKTARSARLLSRLQRAGVRPAPFSATRAIAELDPCRGVIAGFLPAPHLAIHPGRDEPAGNGRVQQDMVDAQAGVSWPGIPEIIPKRINPLTRMEGAQRIGPALRDEAAESGLDLGAEQRV